MNNFMVLSLCVLLSAGCGIVDQMEKTNQKIDTTNNQMTDTNRRIDDTNAGLNATNVKLDTMIERTNALKEGQEFMGGFDAFLNPHFPLPARGAAFEPMLKLGKIERIGKYIGTAFSYISVPALGPAFPNVSIVSDYIIRIPSAKGRKILPIDRVTYRIAATATETLINDLLDGIALEQVTPEKQAEVQQYFERFGFAFTALLGAKEAKLINIPAADGGEPTQQLVLENTYPLEERLVWAKKISDVAAGYLVTDKVKQSVNNHIELKLKSTSRIPAEYIYVSEFDNQHAPN